MLKLLKIDFKILINQWQVILFPIFIWLILFKSVLFTTISVIFGFMFLLNTYEAQYKMYGFYCSLPIKRSYWVINRYTSIILLTFITYFLILLFISVLNLFLSGFFYNFKVETIFLDLYEIICSVLLVLSFYIPSHISFGTVKGFFVFLGSITAFFSLLLGVFYFSVSNTLTTSEYKSTHGIKQVISFLEQLIIKIKSQFGRDNIMLVIFLISIFIYFISMVISIKIYENKEL